MINVEFWKRIANEWTIKKEKTERQSEIDSSAKKVADNLGGEVEDEFLDLDSYLDSFDGLEDF